jgi:acyl-CoA hydrolase
MSMITSNDPQNSSMPPHVALPLDKELVLKVIPMPADCNANGDIFGGWVMAQVDLAGSVIPARHTQGRMATVAVNDLSLSSRCVWAIFCRFFQRSRE